MKLSIISFTEHGKQLSQRIAKLLKTDMPNERNGSNSPACLNPRTIPFMEICLYTKCKACRNETCSTVLFVDLPIGDWAMEQMQEKNALLFIGACGIAVRAIAPSLIDKLHDSPVLVMDEKGNYIIPILSGHVGGANELAEKIAKKTGAQPVITTATDINQTFAVDLFAKKNGLSIVNKDGIVKVSSKILAGKTVTMSIESGHKIAVKEKFEKEQTYAITSTPAQEINTEKENSPEDRNGLPDNIQLIPYPPAKTVDIVISSEEKAFDAAILLKPKEYIIGMGCKRGKSEAEIDGLIRKKMDELKISAQQVFALASISQKSEEQGILAWCQKERIPFLTYPAEELQQVKGTFTTSSFVKEQVGVDNVCERAALKACEETGSLIASKYAEHGMTIAVAKREWNIHF